MCRNLTIFDETVQYIKDEFYSLVKNSLNDRHMLETACGTGYWTEVIPSTAS